MNKAHSAVGWVNEPATDSPLNATNLNKMDNTIGVLDDRIITLDTTKATKTEVSTLFSDVSFNEDTGNLLRIKIFILARNIPASF